MTFCVNGFENLQTEAIQDYDANLITLFICCWQKWIMKLHRNSSTFLGHDFTTDELKPSASKIEVIRNFVQPEDKATVQHLLGMANYILCGTALTSATLHQGFVISWAFEVWFSLHMGWTSHWSFWEIKGKLKSAPVFAYFDDKKPYLIQCDSYRKVLE